LRAAGEECTIAHPYIREAGTMSSNSTVRSLLAALLVLGLVGCSDDTKPTPDKGVDKGVTDIAKVPDKPAGEKLVDKGPAGEAKVDSKPAVDSMVCPADGICGQLAGFLTKAPVSGVQVCVSGSTTPPCVTSDAAGAYSYAGLPLTTTDFALKYTKTDYVTFLAPFGKNQTDRKYNMALLKKDELELLAKMLSVPPPAVTIQPGKGHVILSSYGTTGNAAGTSFTLPANAGGEGPYYVSDAGAPDKSLKETTKGGIGAAVNLTPGTYEVTFKNSKSLTCARHHGWEGGAADKLKVEVVADSMTVVSVACK
jgi:hypothetical protein